MARTGSRLTAAIPSGRFSCSCSTRATRPLSRARRQPSAAYATLSQQGEGNRLPALSLRRLTGKSIPFQMPASEHRQDRSRDKRPARQLRMRRAGGRLRLRRHVGGGHRGPSRSQRPDRREGAALWRHHRAFRRLALDSRHLAGAQSGASSRATSRRGPICAMRPATAFDAARVDAFLTHGPEAVDFFTTQDRCEFRHAADLSGLSRGSAGRRAGRPLDGDAAVRRPRTGRARQGLSAAPCPNSPCSA